MDAPNDERAKRIQALTERISNHSASRALSDWKSLQRVIQAYVTNAEELSMLIAAPEADARLLIALVSQDQEGGARQRYYDGLFRCLHNYLSILATLIDHARNLMRRYKGTDYYTEYELRKDTFSRLPMASFLKDLRNYLLHYEMVPLAIAISLQPVVTNANFRETLDSQRLLAWDSWKKESRSYLEAHDEIVLHDCVAEYTEQVVQLYEWAFLQYDDLHADDIADAQQLQAELQDLLGV